MDEDNQQRRVDAACTAPGAHTPAGACAAPAPDWRRWPSTSGRPSRRWERTGLEEAVAAAAAAVITTANVAQPPHSCAGQPATTTAADRNPLSTATSPAVERPYNSEVQQRGQLVAPRPGPRLPQTQHRFSLRIAVAFGRSKAAPFTNLPETNPTQEKTG